MFGKPLTEAQLQERFQSCLKTSAQGVKFVKLKATLANVRFWDSEGKRTEAPDSLRGRRILAAAQPRQLWVMNQQRGLLLELREAGRGRGSVPLIKKGSCREAFGPPSRSTAGARRTALLEGFNFEPIAPRAPDFFFASRDP